MKVGFQGVKGAYSHLACAQVYPSAQHIGFATFKDVVKALQAGKIDKALLPISNSNAGRVSSVHNLIFESGLYIIGEHFLPVNHCLIAHGSVKLKDVKRVFSHHQALEQSSRFLQDNEYEIVTWSDTAKAAQYVIEERLQDAGALASDFASKIYGGKILKKNVSNSKDNTTRFVVLSKKARTVKEEKGVITSIYYVTKNIPAALYKSLGGFATEGINLVMIESFVSMKRGARAGFYLEFEGNPITPKVARALNELEFYSDDIRILGTYKEEKHR